ncbi:unnamed protein product, partial [Rhizoctonia solani]
ALLFEEYWTHLEYVPKNENHLGAVRSELQGALASCLLDHMTSEGSTSPFTINDLIEERSMGIARPEPSLPRHRREETSTHTDVKTRSLNCPSVPSRTPGLGNMLKSLGRQTMNAFNMAIDSTGVLPGLSDIMGAFKSLSPSLTRKGSCMSNGT